MKYAAIFMSVLVAIGLVLGIYTYANAHLTVTAVSMNAAQGFEKTQEFARLQNAMDQGALLGTAYADTLPGNSLDYVFETYTFRLKNGGLINAEMVEIEPIPLEGDVLSYTTLDAGQVNANLTVPAHQERDGWCVVVHSAGQDELLRRQRKFRVTYYMWGAAKTVTASYQ